MQSANAKVISFNTKVIPQKHNDTVKYTKNGVPKKSGGNKVCGKSSTVYPIKDSKQLKDFIDYFKNQLYSADTEYRKYVAARNYLLIQIGLNTAYRISDICSLKFEDFYDDDGNFCDCTRKQEKKTKKYRTVFAGKQVEEAFNLFFKVTRMEINPEEYIFKTCKGKMTEQNAYTFIKDAAKKVGITQTIGTHSLRKTFSYWSIINHKNDAMFLTKLQRILRHSSPAITLRYAGIEDSENKEIYNDMGSFIETVMQGDYERKNGNVVKISKDCIMDIIKMAYQVGKEDNNVDVTIDIDNVETFENMINEYII